MWKETVVTKFEGLRRIFHERSADDHELPWNIRHFIRYSNRTAPEYILQALTLKRNCSVMIPCSFVSVFSNFS